MRGLMRYSSTRGSHDSGAQRKYDGEKDKSGAFPCVRVEIRLVGTETNSRVDADDRSRQGTRTTILSVLFQWEGEIHRSVAYVL